MMELFLIKYHAPFVHLIKTKFHFPHHSIHNDTVSQVWRSTWKRLQILRESFILRLNQSVFLSLSLSFYLIESYKSLTQLNFLSLLSFSFSLFLLNLSWISGRWRMARNVVALLLYVVAGGRQQNKGGWNGDTDIDGRRRYVDILRSIQVRNLKLFRTNFQ